MMMMGSKRCKTSQQLPVFKSCRDIALASVTVRARQNTTVRQDRNSNNTSVCARDLGSYLLFPPQKWSQRVIVGMTQQLCNKVIEFSRHSACPVSFPPATQIFFCRPRCFRNIERSHSAFCAPPAGLVCSFLKLFGSFLKQMSQFLLSLQKKDKLIYGNG